MAKFKGTAANDSFSGSNGKDKIDGKDGDDTLNGLGGNDHIKGGRGNDVMSGGTGDDKLYGGDGDDWIDGGLGDDKIKGDKGNDTIVDGGGDDDVDAGDGDNTILLAGGDNKVKARDGDDLIETGAGDDKIDAGHGDNTVRAGDGENDIKTKDGNDLIEAGAGDDKVDSGHGDDTVRTGDGDDDIKTKDGDDFVDAGAGDDLIKAGAGDDTVFGGAGGDIILGDGSGSGGSGSGGSFNDYLDGGAGDDWIVGGQGEDILLGGDGNDVLFGDDGGSGKKWYNGSGSASFGASGSGSGGFADYLDGGAGDDFVIAAGGNDEAAYTMSENAGASDDYRGGHGIDTLTLKLTYLEWLQSAVQSDIADYLQFLANHTDPQTGEADSAVFQFSAFDLKAREFENLRVFVDGVELDPTDEAVDAVADAAILDEDASATLFPSVLANDIVPDLVKYVTLVSGPAQGNLVFNEGVLGTPDGSFSFDPAGDFEDLAVGESRDVSFVYEVTDADGDTDQASVTITVTGTNDAPVITSAPTGGGVTEIIDLAPGELTDILQATGTIAFADVDLSDGHSVSVTAASATDSQTAGATPLRGSLVPVIADVSTGDGSGSIDWTFEVPDAAIDDLAAGQVLTQVYELTVDDGNGGMASQNVTITITGTNDAPIATADGNASDAVVESGVAPGNTPFPGDAIANGNVLTNDTDVDASDVLSVSEVNGAAAGVGSSVGGVYGNITINADGSYVYTLDNADPDTEALAKDAAVQDVFDVTVSDGNGGMDTATLTIDITGTNDAPVAQDDVVSATAQTLVVPAGFAVNSENGHGYKFVGANVSWAAASAAAAGMGGHLATLTSASENAFAYALTGGVWSWIGASDAGNEGDWKWVEGPEAGTSFWSGGISGSPVNGEFVIWGSNGEPNGGVGENHAHTWSVDGGSWNDFGGTASYLVEISGPPPVIGSVATNDSDVDTGAVLSFALDAPVAGLTLDGDGSYSFDPGDAAYASLGAGEALNVVATYTVTDQHGASDTATLTITVTGTNDSPSISVESGDSVSATIAETDAGLTASGTLTLSDVDTTDLVGVAVTSVSASGNIADPAAPGSAALLAMLSVPAATVLGATETSDSFGWSFDSASEAFDYLAIGESIVLAYEITATDDEGGTDTQTVTVTVTGTNDAPLAVADTNAGDAVIEKGAIEPGDASASGNVLGNDSDVDTSDGRSVSGVSVGTGATQPADVGSPVIGTYGALTLNADGTWAYALDDADPDTDGLAEGEVVTDVFTYEVSDGNGGTDTATLTISITGSEDNRPPVASDSSETLAEDTAIAASVVSSDADVTAGHGDAITHALVTGPDNGILGFNPDGTFDYTPFADFNGPDSFTYSVTDSFGETDTGTVTLNVTPVNDAPVAASDGNGGDPVVESGVNPGNTPFAGDGGASGNVLTNDGDIDGDTLTVTAVNGFAPGTAVQGIYGTLALNTDGSYAYALNNTDPQTNALAKGTSATDAFTYTISDGNGGTDTATLAIDITGTNDAPVATDFELEANQLGNGGFEATPDFVGWSIDNSLTNATLPSSSSIYFSTADVNRSGLLGGDDAVAVLSFGARVPSRFGTGFGPSITSDAFEGSAGDTVSFEYELTSGGDYAVGTAYIRDANTGAIVQEVFNFQTPFTGSTGVQQVDVILAQSGDFTIDFRVGSYDATGGYYIGATMRIGTAGIVRNGVTEDSVQVFEAIQFVSNAADVDTGAMLSLLSVDGVSSLGANLAIDGNGDVVYDADPLDFLSAGEVRIDTFQYTVTDEHGATSTATASITVNGINDAPVATDDSDTTTQGAALTVSVLGNDDDVDGDTLTVTGVSTAASGAVVNNGDGTVTYIPGAALDALGVGQSASDSFTYTISDGNGGTDTATVNVLITGTNDAPVANDDDGTTTESASVIIDALDNDGDIDGDTLSITSVTQGAQGAVIDNGNGTLTYTPGALLSFLANGDVYNDSFTYTISDGNGGTDTATVNVAVTGEGPATVSSSASGTTPGNNQSFTLSLTGDTTTDDGTAGLTGTLGFGAVVQPKVNVIYVIDVSGSTIFTGSNLFGQNIGDVNNDGLANTVLDAQIVSLSALTNQIRDNELADEGFGDGNVTISTITFESTAPAQQSITPSWVNATQTTTLDDTVGTSVTGDAAQVTGTLQQLRGQGGTNFQAATIETINLIQTLDPLQTETNVVLFLSDGEAQQIPTPGQIAYLQSVAQVNAIGVGPNASLTQLNQLDNTGGAVQVLDTDELTDALLGSPIPDGAVVDADVFIFNGSTTTSTDVLPFLTETQTGLSLDIEAAGLAAALGSANTATLVVGIDDDENGTVDLVLQTEIDIFGIA